MSSIAIINIVFMIILFLVYKIILYAGTGGLFIGVDYVIDKIWIHFVGPIIFVLLNLLLLPVMDKSLNEHYFIFIFLAIPVLTIIYLILRAYLMDIYLNFHKNKIEKTIRSYFKDLGHGDVYSFDKEQIILFKKRAYANKVILKVKNDKIHNEYKDKHEKDLRDRLYNEYHIEILFKNK